MFFGRLTSRPLARVGGVITRLLGSLSGDRRNSFFHHRIQISLLVCGRLRVPCDVKVDSRWDWNACGSARDVIYRKGCEKRCEAAEDGQRVIFSPACL